MTLEEIKKIAAPACQGFWVKRLDLFGSLARGEGTSESDVDLIKVNIYAMADEIQEGGRS